MRVWVPAASPTPFPPHGEFDRLAGEMRAEALSPLPSQLRPADVNAIAEAWHWMTDLNQELRVDVEAYRSPNLIQALEIVEQGTFRAGGSARCIPSAGAIFPYDLVMLTRGTATDGAMLFRLDLMRRAAVLLPVAADRMQRTLETGLIPDGDVVADVLILSRPWLSMRKYGQRGYLYAQLDAGHAATNLLGTALDRGPAALRLRVPRDEVREQLREVLPYRELHSVLSLGPAAQSPDLRAWSSVRQHGDAGPERHRDLERYCWSGIPRHLIEGRGQPRPVVDRPLIGPAIGLAAGEPIERGRWRELAHLRRSCKQFSDDPPAGPAVDAAAKALATSLPTDLPRLLDDGLRVTLAVAPGPLADFCRSRLPGSSVDVVVSDQLSDRDVIRRACMGQQHLGAAGAFILCHVKRDLLVSDADGQTLRDAIFRAASIVQLLYLGGARSGIAVTAVGGQDVTTWRCLAGMPADNELLYMLALGRDKAGLPKFDRAELAYAHGE
ncbi:hypothetical protein [Micromonospora sp. NPDC093277]|uniref:hypothetical protein n=1 Tax=Micromonospora sp. NPDC093277 TaxID=3364291 RepID=UPI0037F36E13